MQLLRSLAAICRKQVFGYQLWAWGLVFALLAFFLWVLLTGVDVHCGPCWWTEGSF
jgi:hypothetical protein